MISLLLDPVWQAPLFGSMLICGICALLSVFVVLRKESLIGESLSHASYPGLTLALVVSSVWSLSETGSIIAMILGGFVASISSLFILDWMQKKHQISADSSLCFILSFFFGIGLFITSMLQTQFAGMYHLMQDFLFGSASILTMRHVQLYFGLSVFIAMSFWALFSSLKITTFDRSFAQVLGIRCNRIDKTLLFLVALCICCGIPTVGIVLVSGLLITPAVAARQYTDHLGSMLLLSVLFGVLSAAIGNAICYRFSMLYPTLSMPTGPVILLVSSAICFFSICFAPKRGLLFRWIRSMAFQYECRLEHLLKTLWRDPHISSWSSLREKHPFSRVLVWILRSQGWVRTDARGVELTQDGKKRAARLVRLHRLWEVYLTESLNIQKDRVHTNADQIEHILIGDLEERLEEALGSVTQDPHKSEIPAREVTR